VTSNSAFKFRVATLSLVLGATFFTGCNQSGQTGGLLSLRRSGKATFICVGPDGKGAPIEKCPVGPSTITSTSTRSLTVASPDHDLYALVTQTASAEVALIRVSARPGVTSAAVLDVDPTNPGVTALRVGQYPGDIVTTEGGMATFVGVRDASSPGIFGLPTSCLWAPREGEIVRDLTTWPACSLPVAPGAILVVSDGPDDEGRLRRSCFEAYEDGLGGAAADGDGEDADCRVDLSEEATALGRQKLVVALPGRSSVAVIDAQTLLDRPAGSFAPCEIEFELPLSNSIQGSVSQTLPRDLAGEGCFSETLSYEAPSGTFTSRPAGLAHADDVLYVGDQGAPLIHRIQTTDVCAPREIEPLRTASMFDPSRVVTTSEVRVSPRTTDGKRFLYAIDESPSRPASVMIYDVSTPVSPSAPLVREGSKEAPFEAPDRIEFASAVKDIGFIRTDDPVVDPDTNVGEFGVLCNPDPSLSSSDPATFYRPNEGLTAGAGTTRRGIFAYVLTSDGSVNVVDVEDYDAACRRPIGVNADAEPDFRGCSGDTSSFSYLTENGRADGIPTVTDEASCRVVEPHRARSRGKRGFFVTNETLGTGAPTLLSAPRLSLYGRITSPSRDVVEGRKNPILLGVDFGDSAANLTPAFVYVGTGLREKDSQTAPLDIDPRTAQQSSVVLPFVEPRAYPSSETVSVVYDGDLDGQHTAGRLLVEAGKNARLLDVDAAFCRAGVQDVRATTELLAQDFSLSEALARDIAEPYADYIQITSPVPLETDDYWQREGASCVAGTGFAGCDSLFGLANANDLRRARDLRVQKAHQSSLEVTPASLPEGSSVDEHLNNMLCCMPGPLNYRIRASQQWVVRGTVSGYLHPIVPVPNQDGDYECRVACDPVRGSRRGRAFELSSTTCTDPAPERADFCGVGPRTPSDAFCFYDGRGPVVPGGQGDSCIYDSGTRRFAIYRGLVPSQRGMAFVFDVGGGFIMDGLSLPALARASVLPESLLAVPTFGAVGVVDAADRGLMIVDVRSNAIATQFY
jgi:hypothetical protein